MLETIWHQLITNIPQPINLTILKYFFNEQALSLCKKSILRNLFGIKLVSSRTVTIITDSKNFQRFCNCSYWFRKTSEATVKWFLNFFESEQNSDQKFIILLSQEIIWIESLEVTKPTGPLVRHFSSVHVRPNYKVWKSLPRQFCLETCLDVV